MKIEAIKFRRSKYAMVRQKRRDDGTLTVKRDRLCNELLGRIPSKDNLFAQVTYLNMVVSMISHALRYRKTFWRIKLDYDVRVWFMRGDSRWIKRISLDYLHKEHTDFKAVMKSLCSSAYPIHVLSASLTVIQEKLSSLIHQTNSAILDHGVLGLPHDLLEYIMELTYDNSSRNLTQITGVCRHLRTIALSRRSLWADIANIRSPKWVSLQLKRSGRSGLKIRFVPFACRDTVGILGRCYCLEFVRAVVNERHRWIRVDLHGSCRVHPREFQSLLTGLRIPQLQVLDVQLGGSETFKQWYMPSLKSLKSMCDIFPMGFDNHNLQSLQICIYCNEQQSGYLADLFRRSSLARLERLDLDFNPITCLAGSESVSFSPIQLNKLSHLSVSYRFYWEDLTITMINFLCQLQLPHLRKLQVNIVLNVLITREHCAGPHMALLDWISGCEWPNLEEIHFRLANMDGSQYLDLDEQRTFLTQRVLKGRSIASMPKFPEIIVEEFNDLDCIKWPSVPALIY